ncbi:MAG TPA: Uma2 family endonuclease [Chthonomonadaceae bacterium]|nr:Uma2 family endonuclease [Chthonomonadaceae bacterium]
MANLLMETEEIVEGRVVRIAEHPIPFERFVEMANGQNVELVDGVIVEKAMVQLDHELCSGWLYQIIGPYVEERGLGRMLSSRIMVQADNFGGRMPDLLFVRQERIGIVQQKAVYGAPDLIIEIVSPNDRPADLRALEADYHRLGVPELIFIHLRKQEIHLLHRQDASYETTTVTSGPITLATIPGLTLQAEWILQEPRPGVRATLNALLSNVDY